MLGSSQKAPAMVSLVFNLAEGAARAAHLAMRLREPSLLMLMFGRK